MLIVVGVVFAFIIGMALWQHLQLERMRSVLTRLGSFLGDTHDLELEKAWGRELGVRVSVGLHDPLRETPLRYLGPSRFTEICVELPAAFPIMLHVDSGWSGQRVYAAPAEVTKHLVDEATLAALRELRIKELTIVAGEPPVLRVRAKGWMLDMERAQRAASLAAGLVRRMAPALSEAEAEAEAAAAANRVMVGEPYRGQVDDSSLKRVAEARAAELERVRREVESEVHRRRWIHAALAVVALTLAGVVAVKISYLVLLVILLFPLLVRIS